MPKRLNTKRVACDEVQGDDSFVVLRRPTYGEAMAALRAQDSDSAEQREQVGRALLAGRVVEWNWVDDDGQLLPLPSTDLQVIERLTDQEVEFLFRSLSSAAVEAEGKG